MQLCCINERFQIMNKYFVGYNIDFFGFFASFLCAIHCSLLPFVMTVGMLSGLSWMAEPWVEVTFIILSIILATMSLYPSYKKQHHKDKALKIAGLGFALLLISRLVGHGSRVEVIAIVIGGLLIAVAHVVNWRLLKTSKLCCAHSIKPASNKLKKAS